MKIKLNFLLFILINIICTYSYSSQSNISILRQGYFYVGGDRTQVNSDSIIVNQMFVQYQIPTDKKSLYPIVLIHDAFQNGSNFLGTPDGREGWEEYF